MTPISKPNGDHSVRSSAKVGVIAIPPHPHRRSSVQSRVWSRCRLFFRYNEKNVVLSGTHSHSGPAGFFQFLLFEVTSLGYIKQSTDSFVDGVVKSIEMGKKLTLFGCIIEVLLQGIWTIMKNAPWILDIWLVGSCPRQQLTTVRQKSKANNIKRILGLSVRPRIGFDPNHVKPKAGN